MNRQGADLLKVLEQGTKQFLPHHSVDVVIFGYEKTELKILLLEVLEDQWTLSGGYLKRTESLEEAATRTLEERTGLTDVYMQQFYTFSHPERSFSSQAKQIFIENGLPWNKDLWMNQRFISTGFYALVNLNEISPRAGIFSRSIAWHNVNSLPPMMMDHKEIIHKAIEKFRSDLSTNPLAHHLLPKKFTMPELHRVYETVYQKKMDRSRFQKKMFEYDVFQRLDELREGVPHKRPYLYSVKQ